MSSLFRKVIGEMPSAHLVDCVRFDFRLNLAVIEIYASLVCRSCHVSTGQRQEPLAYPLCKLGSKAAAIWLSRRKHPKVSNRALRHQLET